MKSGSPAQLRAHLDRCGNRMKKIGIVGGVGWQSTVHYYSELCRRSEHLQLATPAGGVPSIPEISIESLDLAKAVSYLGRDEDEESWAQFDDYHRSALMRLAASGADFALMASNSPHHRFEAIVRGIPIPVIDIVNAVAKESTRMGARQVLILGTALTMRSARFREGFAKYGIQAAGPQDEAAKAMTVELITDLQMGKIAGGAERVEKIARLSFGHGFSNQPAVCLACTELPLAFEMLQTLESFRYGGILFLNASIVHINAAFKFATDQ